MDGVNHKMSREPQARETKDVVIHLRLSKTDKARLDKLCKRDRRTQAQMVAWLIERASAAR